MSVNCKGSVGSSEGTAQRHREPGQGHPKPPPAATKGPGHWDWGNPALGGWERSSSPLNPQPRVSARCLPAADRA